MPAARGYAPLTRGALKPFIEHGIWGGQATPDCVGHAAGSATDNSAGHGHRDRWCVTDFGVHSSQRLDESTILAR
jgi:hypothetical protein